NDFSPKKVPQIADLPLNLLFGLLKIKCGSNKPLNSNFPRTQLPVRLSTPLGPNFGKNKTTPDVFQRGPVKSWKPRGRLNHHDLLHLCQSSLSRTIKHFLNNLVPLSS
ncbi:uncharacterized protein TM35_000173330, partial [Trypanosoma theileri]